ncbi:hypothetical protein EYF80_057985 [Liparis tanakae]|uniref:Uncharacterized protein n=1 Tax=Liparis tanakae TaxID=230148 RepID=A0A4Z2EST5_9TELE|nr:hypothetical protein EYF80_057985 [Liparis tanakae]
MDAEAPMLKATGGGDEKLRENGGFLQNKRNGVFQFSPRLLASSHLAPSPPRPLASSHLVLLAAAAPADLLLDELGAPLFVVQVLLLLPRLLLLAPDGLGVAVEQQQQQQQQQQQLDDTAAVTHIRTIHVSSGTHRTVC